MADYQYINTTGLVIPDTADVLSTVQQEFKDALQKQDLVMTADTPQGVLATAEALARTNVITNNAALANQINPNIAGGVFLDAIMALTGMQRTPQTKTVVSGVTLTGVPGTVISAGTVAQTAAGDQFESQSTITLNASGNGAVDFASISYGPIPCAASALNQIVTSVLGWETVNNSTAGALGTTTQSDASARALRNNTLAYQGVGLAEAITSALYATDGVRSLTFRENTADSTQTIDGISMISHSIYVCIDGGSDLDVAAALLENKSSGCGWNGGTSVSVIEPASGQNYTVKFDRPSLVHVLVRITTPNGNASNITQSVLDYVAGNISGFSGYKVGEDVSTFEIAGAVLSENVGITISKVEISLYSPVSYSTNPISIGINQIASTTLSDITVVIA